jgi:hypothetical protein
MAVDSCKHHLVHAVWAGAPAQALRPCELGLSLKFGICPSFNNAVVDGEIYFLYFPEVLKTMNRFAWRGRCLAVP